MAITNEGTAIVPTEIIPVIRSSAEFGRNAARQPNGMPNRMAQPRPADPSASVKPMFSPMIWVTGRFENTSSPRSPVATLPAKIRNWRQTGSSRCIFSVNRAMVSGLARGPSAMVAGSPGIRCKSANVTNTTRAMTVAERPSRLIR